MKKDIRDFCLDGKNVVIRCDLNVTLSDGKILDDTRITSSVKSIKYILDNGGKAIILSHLGKIKTDSDKDKYSLRVVFNRLKELIPNLSFCDSLDFDQVRDFVNNVNYGDAVLLENTRFYDLDGKLESGNSEILSKFYASLGDIFINDAFGTMHRAHASNVGISNYLESGIGFLVLKELENLEVLFNPKPLFGVIMGGSKISDKLKVIDSLIERVDVLLIGGAMANTFLKAKGYDIGNSLYEEEMVNYCKDLILKYDKKIVLPVDFYGDFTLKDESGKYFLLDQFNDMMQLDIGPKTIELFKSRLNGVNTLFWNGPVGYTDFSSYSYGTFELLKVIKDIPYTILGGGDVVGACKRLNCQDDVTFLSTGGGATLDYIANRDLVGLKNIKEK